MLFVFDATVANIDTECLIQIRAIENLLGAFQGRNHMVFGDMKILRILIERLSPVISASSRVMLTMMLNGAVEAKTGLDQIEYKVNVFLDEEKPRLFKQGNVWHVSLKYLGESGLLQSAIIGENELDAELFLILAELYRRRHRIRLFGTKARIKGGGGSGLPQAMEAYLDSETSPCLSISDSDKYHPTCELSLTVKRCRKIATERNAVVEYLHLEEREIENLLPREVLEQIVDLDRFLSECDNLMAKMPQLWPYADLKNGPSLKWIKARDGQTQTFWKQFQSQLEKKRGRCRLCDPEDEAISDVCACSQIKGFGPGLLEKAISYLKDTPPHVVLRLLANDLRWERIGRIAFNFALAPLGERVAS
jgi:hypothetical protein